MLDGTQRRAAASSGATRRDERTFVRGTTLAVPLSETWNPALVPEDQQTSRYGLCVILCVRLPHLPLPAVMVGQRGAAH